METSLNGLSSLTSVGGGLSIFVNASLTNLDGLSALTLVSGNLYIDSNAILPYCEVCDLIDQIGYAETTDNIYGNDTDTCWNGALNCP